MMMRVVDCACWVCTDWVLLRKYDAKKVVVVVVKLKLFCSL